MPYYIDTCAAVLTNTLFTIYWKWKQPLPDELIKKMWQIFTREFHSTVNNNESCGQMDETRKYFTECGNPGAE